MSKTIDKPAPSATTAPAATTATTTAPAPATPIGAPPPAQRPYMGYYNPPPELIATEEGPWIAAGATLLLNTALTVVAVNLLSAPLPFQAWIVYLVQGFLALLGVGLILGSEACRWVWTVLVLLINAVLMIGIATGSITGLGGMNVQPITAFISGGLAVTGWLLMLVRNPGPGKSVAGFLLVMAGHGVAVLA